MSEISDVVEAAKVAGQFLPRTVATVDSVVSSIVGVFDLLMYPIKKANIEFKYKLEQFALDLQSRIEARKDGAIKVPDIEIVGPVLEAMRYTIDNTELRELYMELLATASDEKREQIVHPSYVEVIRRMSSFDAKLFRFLAPNKGYVLAANPKIHISNSNKYYVNAMPDWFVSPPDFIDDIFMLSASLVRLGQFGLLDLMYDRSATGADYSWVLESPLLKRQMHDFMEGKDANVSIQFTKSVVVINDNGRQFASACGIV